MPYRPNYPATVAEVLEPAAPVLPRGPYRRPGGSPRSKPYRGDAGRSEGEVRGACTDDLCAIVRASRPTLAFGVLDGRDSGASYYRPSTDLIVLCGRAVGGDLPARVRSRPGPGRTRRGPVERERCSAAVSRGLTRGAERTVTSSGGVWPSRDGGPPTRSTARAATRRPSTRNGVVPDDHRASTDHYPHGPASTAFSEVIGQRAAVERLRVAVAAARADDRPLDHFLLTGAGGYWERPCIDLHRRG